jgi:hypothetical protein
VILLVGQTGVGKTMFLNLIANILDGRGPRDYQAMHDASNEDGGSRDQSQTKEAFVYEFRSLNGVKIRVLDTPGLADTHGMGRDEKHMASITRVIENTIPVIDGVVILANGTVERLHAATDYAITTLGFILPTSIADNIVFVFTMVDNPLRLNFRLESLPDSLQRPKLYLLDNPIALTRRYEEREQLFPDQLSNMPTTIGDAHANAVGMLSEFFDWLDQCTVRHTSAIVELYNKICTVDRHIQDAIACTSSVSAKKQDIVRINADILRANQVGNLWNIYHPFKLIHPCS